MSVSTSQTNAQCLGLRGNIQSLKLNQDYNSQVVAAFNAKVGGHAVSSVELMAIQLDDHIDPIADDCNEFVPIDGFMHMAASGIMQLGFQYLYEEKFGLGKNLSAILAAGSTFSVGVAKEFWDQDQQFNCFSNADLFMNSMGIISGLTIVYAF